MEVMCTSTGYWQIPSVASYILSYVHEAQLTNLTLFANKYAYRGLEIYISLKTSLRS